MFNLTHLVQNGGLALIGLLIFAESGMFVGFVFPGDTLLITAGVFAAQGKLSLAAVIIVVAAAAILGDNVGYQIGKKYGRRLFKKEDSLIFNQDHIHRTEKFYDKYGAKAMLFAHFAPVIRTFAPPVAGVAEMKYKQFVLFDAIGDIAWAAIITLLGYWFGAKIPNIDNYVLIVVAVVVVIILGPTLFHIFKTLRIRNKKSNAVRADANPAAAKKKS